jgi:amino acid adenylation domain-containing protein
MIEQTQAASSGSEGSGSAIPAGTWIGAHRNFREAMLPQLFEEQAARTPEKVAVSFGTDEWSFARLNQRANRFAHRLVKLGAAPDTLVAIAMERSLDLPAALLAVLKAGAAYVPLDPGYPAERLESILADCDARVLVTTAELQSRFAPTGATPVLCLDADDISNEPDSNPGISLAAAQLAYVIHTSGSTGRPKGAMIPHGAIANHMLWMQEAFPLTAADRVLQKTAISFDASVWEFYAPLLAGAQLVMARPGGHRTSRYLIETVIREEITILQLVPSMLQALVEEPDFAACVSLRRMFCGGEALTPELCTRFFAKLPGCELVNLYGPTECTIDATFHRCAPGEKVVPIGLPVANTQLYILGLSGNELRPGEVGELHIGGAQLARGYLNEPALTAGAFIEHAGRRLYKTGDLARGLPNGEVEYLGRLDHQLKIRGNRIEPGEIEAALRRHEPVREAVVTVRELRGAPELVAYFTAPMKVPVAELRETLSARLPDHMIPAVFVQLERWPHTSSGKIDRKALPAPEAPHAPRYVAPESGLEQVIAAAWSEVIGIAEVGVNDNFFDTGGNSLRMAEVHARLERTLNRPIEITDLFEHPTVRSLARFLVAGAGRESVLSIITERARKKRDALARE